MKARKKTNLTQFLKTLPDEPGIYKMIDAKQSVIYVGKAKNIKRRVASYFSRRHGPETKIAHLVDQIQTIETIVTRTEFDALILEAQLVKTLQPKYNVLLKDDKSYPYIKITTQDHFPRILVVRERQNDKATYFGPYPSIGSTRHLVRMLYELFPLRDCKQHIALKKKQPKCIQLDLDRCIGPCIFKGKKEQYDQLVAELLLLLSGKNKALLKKLQNEMIALSDEKAYEKAAIIRDRIQKLNRLTQRQVVALSEDVSLDIWCMVSNDAFYYILTQGFITGKLLFQKGFFSPKSGIDDQAQFIRQSVVNWYSEEKRAPKVAICDSAVLEVLSETQIVKLFDHAPQISQPMRGVKRELLEMAQKNAQIALLRLTKEAAIPPRVTAQPIITDIKERLHLTHKPYKIIGFDVSHLQGQDIVASAVCFENGVPSKHYYRKFKIRSISQKSHDPASIREAVYRRLRQCLEKEEQLPELLLIDGGVGQLNFALEAVAKLRVINEVEVVALAKKEEALYLPGHRDPLKLSRRDPVLTLFQRIRDEAHRFAVTFQKRQRKNRFESGLSQIKGVGPIRLNRLYLQFKTLEAIKNASPEQLAMAAKMGQNQAARLVLEIQKIDPKKRKQNRPR